MRWLLVVTVLIVSMLAPREAGACLWDRDTLAQEAAGAPHVVGILVGGFARNPARYYEMRLERASKEVAKDPDALEAYDDAAVACDRLKRADEAIEWMAKKHVALERLGKAARKGKPNHWYRYHANLGTFHAHRWLGNGADFASFDDLERARDLIRKAIDENPDAHFGREKYQLKAIEWLLTKPKAEQYSLPSFLGIPDEKLHATSDTDTLAKMGMKDAVEGVAGLIALGAAWNSVDMTYALATALQADGKHVFALFAKFRLEELVEAGGKSLVSGAPEGSKLVELLSGHMVEDPAEVKEDYDRLRKAADAWHERRTAYVNERLDRGEHPDTHPAFFTAFEGDPHRFVAEPKAAARGKPNPEAKNVPGNPGHAGRCGCEVVGRRAPGISWAWSALGIVALLIRRRRYGMRTV